MVDRFDTCLTFVLEMEGGYSNSPADHGAATNRGVTQAVYDDWRIAKGQPRQPVVGISMDEVRAIYRQNYWTKVRAEFLPEPLDLAVFDAAVNSGPARAARWLQAAVGVKQDGAIGPQTVAAVNAAVEKIGAKEVARAVTQLREHFIYDIIERDPTQVVFQKGWLRRLADVRTAINEV